MNGFARAWLACALLAPLAAAQSVGLPGRIEELVLPGSELEVRARSAEDPIVLRITRVSPHGDGFRYDLEYTGLEPGKFDLRDALRRKDGTPLTSETGAASPLPPIEVEITSVLAPGVVKPNAPRGRDVPAMGGYVASLIAGGVAWIVGLVLILRMGRKRGEVRTSLAARPRTLAERLTPLVERAMKGELTRSERAQLEMSLVAFWRRKLGLEADAPAQTLPILRRHPQAGPLLESLEAWLHQPNTPRDVDLQALLAPYADLPADAMAELDATSASGAKP